MNKGGIIVISGPSGVGKTTLYKRLLGELSGILVFSVSATTRAPRVGEKHGVDYYFLSREDFERARDAGEFVEWAEVYGNYYGTLKSELQRIMSNGNIALLDVDVQGGMNIKKEFPESYLIFILPPSMESLRQRIEKRCSDSPEAVRKRLLFAHRELQMVSHYDCCIENADLEKAYDELKKVVFSYFQGRDC